MFNVIKSTVLSAVVLASVVACSEDETTSISVSRFEDTARDLDLSRGEYTCYGIDTTLGSFTVALDEKHAPISAENFAQYVTEGFYQNVVFHNVVKDSFIQTGVYDTSLEAKALNTAVEGEASNGLKNYRGRLTMAPSSSAGTSAASFFVNIQDNNNFDGVFTVFGGVVEGMDVVDTISEVQVSSRDGFDFLPNQNVIVNSVAEQSCPAVAESVQDKPIVLPYPVLADDSDAAIDVSRGDYACYTMVTSLGNIELAIDELYAPSTAANFQQYVDSSFYDGVIFHRVIDDFMIQSGGFTSGLVKKETQLPIESESLNGLKNYRGRIAMARTSAPHSATSQFFINVVDNDFLDASQASDGWGYTVFGGVISGMDIVDQIKVVDTTTTAGFQNVPVNEVTVDSVTVSSCPAQ